jgi:hypothetical protein
MGESLSNNTGALVAARYKWDQFQVDAGYTWSSRPRPAVDSADRRNTLGKAFCRRLEA